ncbi:MAG: TlpA disulfide reductase family protein [Methylococcales bacterium]|nr:TlpA disulfide reductase family protein [Methylococcales bacterium]
MPEQFRATIVNTRSILAASVLFVLACISVLAINRIPIQAPDVTFTTITGKKIVLKKLRGKPVIVTFWATDCPGCIKEIPDLIDLYRQYHKQGLEIIAVAMYYDPPNHVIALTENLKLPYHVALDLAAEHARAFGDVQLIPRTFLINPDGSFALKKTGAFDPAEIKTYLHSTHATG